jgi:hypothetical protein
MTAVPACSDERRRALTGDSDHNGIDFLEVDPADQTRLSVRFLQPLPGETGGVPTAGAALAPENLVVEGGVRIAGIAVRAVAADSDELTVTVDRSGDFSRYKLRLVAAEGASAPPPGFDPALAAVEFSFKVACPTTFDCRAPEAPAPPATASPTLDHLAKDYASFLRAMADRIALIAPDWTEWNPADPQVALLELVAYAADRLSYRQDAAATEAYLTTARSRVSVRRHARLLDYALDEGCSARTWVVFEVAPGSPADGGLLAAGTPVTTAGEDPVVFETATPVELRAARSAVAIHTWSDRDCLLPAGATSATLVDDPPLGLASGDVLVLEEGLDPARRHAVRIAHVVHGADPIEGDLPVAEVEWHRDDALPFALDPAATVVRANVALADHGHSVAGAELDAVGDDPRPYRPPLPLDALSHVVPVDPDDRATPATAMLAHAAGPAVPALELSDGAERWTAAPDLLGAGPATKAFVVEIERDGSARLRFGDGAAGARPPAGTAFTIASARTGAGTAGNVGPNTLVRAESALAGITRVDNPLPALGGTAPEDIEHARQAAPVAFAVQQRAVTEADWVEVARRHPEVQRAAARIRWTGSWYTVFVVIDRFGGGPVRDDPPFSAAMLAHLDPFRVAGYDLELRDPEYVPIDLALRVCVAPEAFRSEVERALGPALAALFDPDRLTFGDPVFLSAVHAAAQAVDGVERVLPIRFRRFGKAPAGELEAGVLGVGDLEVPRLDNDPSFPEHGRIELQMEGGR